MAQLGVRVDETFRVFAKRWGKSKRLRIDQSSVSDYQWRLGYLLRFFGRYRLREMTTAVVDRFRDELHDQAETIRAAQARAAASKNGRPLMETVTDRRGRTYQRRAPAVVEHVDQRDDQAARPDPAAGGRRRADRPQTRFGSASAPRGSCRAAAESDVPGDRRVHAVLDAAGELESEARADRKGLGRRAMCATLGLAGFRISEMLELRCATVDLLPKPLQAAGREDRSGDPRGRDDPLPTATNCSRMRSTGVAGAPVHAEGLLLRHRDGQAPRSRPFPRPDPRPRDRARERQPIPGRAARTAGDHAALAAPHVGDVRGVDRPRPEMDRRADRSHRPAVHVLGLPAGRHAPLH